LIENIIAFFVQDVITFQSFQINSVVAKKLYMCIARIAGVANVAIIAALFTTLFFQ